MERKSKLNVFAGILFLLVAAFAILVLNSSYLYFFKGYGSLNGETTFALILTIIQILTYVLLAIAFFAGKVSGIFTALFSLLTLVEAVNCGYIIYKYSDAGYFKHFDYLSSKGKADVIISIVGMVVAVIAMLVAAAVSSSSSKRARIGS